MSLLFSVVGLSQAYKNQGSITFMNMLKSDASFVIAELGVPQEKRHSFTVLETLDGDTPKIREISSYKLKHFRTLHFERKVLMVIKPIQSDEEEMYYSFCFQTENPQEIAHIRSLFALDYSPEVPPDRNQTEDLILWLADALTMPGLYKYVTDDLINLLKRHQKSSWSVNPMVFELVESVLLEKKWNRELLDLALLLETESYCIRDKARDEIWNLRQIIRTTQSLDHKTDASVFRSYEYGLVVTGMVWFLEDNKEAFNDLSPEQQVSIFDELLTEIIWVMDIEAACFR